ncbi:DUF421 domain-containing protein [Terrilactibacillus laevilacticus]|uniref:DUF421 domain-containing protein n=1 Tax=Terrilactibacillus laevilacticus TaxID=1380157 RepID=A0ABW5PNH1_9BACI|nr:YetF domain-containing protein [Terrilactibacillus laevilacticus]
MYLTTTYKLLVVFVCLWVFVRIQSNKKMRQLTALDFIHLFIVTNMLANYLNTPPNILGLIYAIAFWAVLIYLLEFLTRKRKGRKIIYGQSSPLIHNGNINIKEFKKNNLEMEQLRILLREQGVYSLFDVKHAILEIDGSLTVVKKEDPNLSALLVDEGEIIEEQLHRIDQNKEWLRKELSKKGYDNVNDLYCVEWSKRNGFYIKSMSEKTKG